MTDAGITKSPKFAESSKYPSELYIFIHVEFAANFTIAVEFINAAISRFFIPAGISKVVSESHSLIKLSPRVVTPEGNFNEVKALHLLNA